MTHIMIPLVATFNWEASNDEKTWISVSKARVTSTRDPPSMRDISENKGMWSIQNTSRQGKKKYPYWRLLGTGGKMTSRPYVNILLMRIA